MKQPKLKEEPFYVKRIRLKQSVLKTNQILQTMSFTQSERRKFKTVREGDHLPSKVSHQYSRIQRDTDVSHQFDFYSTKVSFTNYERMKNILKGYKSRQADEQQNKLNMIGLDVRRIVGDPKARPTSMRKSSNFEKKSLNNTKNTYIKTLEVEKDTFIDSDRDEVIESYKSQFCTVQSSNRFYKEEQQSEEKVLRVSTPRTSMKKNKVYLYQKLAGTQKGQRDEANHVYEKRIKSYTQFIWKVMLAHNIYINLDLLAPQLSIKKLKAFVGYGNNCNMIKGLIKRRFWWTICQENNQDCLFVWTQLKVNKIFQRQQSSEINQPNYLEDQQVVNQKKRLSKTCVPQKRRFLFKQDLKFNQADKQMHDIKIWTDKDKKVFSSFLQKYKPSNLKAYSIIKAKQKQYSYGHKTKQINQHSKQITIIDNLNILDIIKQQTPHNFYKVRPIIHNHLENNFHLGNKKALFYNLKQYYNRQQKQVFDYLPLTFHIKNGFKDPQYKRFVMYHEQRQKKIKKQQEQQLNHSKRMRNIWIVKPGQNTNQGRGITVIDEVYELNSIIKQSQTQQKLSKEKDNSRTFIVQMYIDRPLLYNDRKFDIRHFVLITHLYGIMRAYWYEEGYIRTSSYPFNIQNFDPQIHLTNDSIQKRTLDYGRYQPANKISYSEFQNYLTCFPDKKYDFKRDFIPKMKTIAIDAVRSVYTKLAPKNQMNNFQIFGLDYMIDRNFRPWLIEINTNPCLDCMCPLLDRIIPYMVEQSLKLSLDIVYPPPCHYPNTSKHFTPFINLETFKYQLIFDSTKESGTVVKKLRISDKNIMAEIGDVAEDEEFQDNGQQIKLEDFT